MNKSESRAAAGGWVILCSLANGEKTFDKAVLRGCIATFAAMRRKRGEGIFAHVQGSQGLFSDPNLYRIFGRSAMNLDETKKALHELGSSLEAALNNKVEIHVNGERLILKKGSGPELNMSLN